MGPSLKPYPSLGQMRNGVFKIKCFGQKMRKRFRSVPHFPRQIVRDVPPPPRKSCHTLGKVSVGSTKVLSFNAVLTSCTGKLSLAWSLTLWITTKEFHLLVSNTSHIEVCSLSCTPHWLQGLTLTYVITFVL